MLTLQMIAAGAQYQLALCWRNGTGVEADDAKALLWLRKVLLSVFAPDPSSSDHCLRL